MDGFFTVFTCAGVFDGFPVTLFLGDLGRDGFTDELDTDLGHVVADLVGQLLVEASEEDRPHHHRYVDAQTMEEACTLEGDV